MSKRQICLVYSCDEYKTWDSMRLMLATTSVRRLKSYLAHMIETGELTYFGVGETKKEKAKSFSKDFKTETRGGLNAQLDCVYLDYVYDGEEV